MTETAALPLKQQICFALYSASRSITGRYRELLAPLGIMYPQYLVLLVLWESGPSTVGELGDRLDLDSGTLSPLLRRLELMGLGARARSRSVRPPGSRPKTLVPCNSRLRARLRIFVGAPELIASRAAFRPSSPTEPPPTEQKE